MVLGGTSWDWRIWGLLCSGLGVTMENQMEETTESELGTWAAEGRV